MRSKLLILCMALVAFTIVAGCSGDDDDDIDDEAAVQQIVDNFLPTLMRITSAGLAAKDTAAQGANIPEIVFPGFVSGSAAIGGTVAQSSGENQNLSLFVGLTDYADTDAMSFQTDNSSDNSKLQFDLNIKNQPADNSMDGILTGTLTVGGDVDGDGVFDLDLVSDLADDDAQPDIICTHVTGTVAVTDSTLTVNFVLPLGLSSSLQAACMTL